MNYYIINYGLILIPMIITIGAQVYINVTYNKFSKVKNNKKISGLDAAQKILKNNGMDNVYVVETKGHLTDHYDPNRKVVRLSSFNFNEETISSVAVAAHECGHAIQDKENYALLRIRSLLVPVVNFSTNAGYFAILIGIIFSSLKLFWIGIFLELIIVLFQLITLPVEIDASRRGLHELEKLKLLSNNEIRAGRNVLIAAALTYVASVASSIIEVIRLIFMAVSNDDN